MPRLREPLRPPASTTTTCTPGTSSSPTGLQKQILDVAPEDPRIVRLRDAYLEPFTAESCRPELAETLELACRVGKIARSLIWLRTVSSDPAEERWRRAPFTCLAAIRDDSYMSGA